MRQLTITLLLLFCLTSSGQNFGGLFTTGYWTIKGVQKEVEKEIKKGKQNGTIPFSFKSINGDTITYIIQHTTDGFTLKFGFNLVEFEERYCDFQEYIFDCTPCSQKHLREFLDNYKFRQKSENVYLSSFTDKTEMTIKYKSDNKDCLILVFRHVRLNKKEYNAVYKNLNKKTTA